ncbi:hypothetical protein BDZ89DRAFT_1060305, partial [Hymenopellis radicata]
MGSSTTSKGYACTRCNVTVLRVRSHKVSLEENVPVENEVLVEQGSDRMPSRGDGAF